MKLWQLVSVLVVTVALGGCHTPLFNVRAPSDPGALADYAVGFTSRTFTRAMPDGQTRKLTTDVWYPARADQHPELGADPLIGAPANIASNNDVRHPLVIYSPGLGASPTGASIFLTQLASEGLVVAAPEHDDCQASYCRLAPQQTAQRPGDIQSVLDNVLSLSASEDPVLKNLIDPDHIGLAGQSLGGWTTLAVLQQGDPRFKAGLLINPATLPSPRPDPGQVSKPTLFMAGELDREAAFSVTQDFFEHIPQTAPDHYLLVVPRAGHEFNNSCNGALVTVPCAQAIPQPRLLEIEAKLATAFLRRYVVGDASYNPALDPASTDGSDYALVADMQGAPRAAVPTILPSANTSPAPVATPIGPPGTVVFHDSLEHVITSSDAISAQTLLPGDYANTNVAIDVQMVDPLPGDFVSVSCRNQGVGDRYEFVVLPRSGIFVIQRLQQNEAAQLTASRPSPAFRTGDQSNHLEFNCRGTTLSASINGTEVAAASDNTFGDGRLATGIGSFSSQKGQREGHFSNVVVTQV